jgi:ELWxxDGT repeat protein
MKTIYLFTLLCLFCTAVKSQYVEKVTSINYSGQNGLNPSNLTVFNGKLYFFGTDNPKYLDKLMFTADGSAAGVTVVKQIDTMTQYQSLRHLTILNNLLVFDNYQQLWKSDGTTAGTSSIATIATTDVNYVVLNNKVYFAGDFTNPLPNNDQLCQTDGTASGTTLVKTINPTGPAHISNLFSYGGKIYFVADDGVHNGQLWVSDGTEAGTTLLKIIDSPTTPYPNNFVGYNGKVFFSAVDNVSEGQLWVTDGTPTGTLKVTNINPGSNYGGLFPRNFTLFNSKLFFMGADTTLFNQQSFYQSFYQLWSTDGTSAGTVIVKSDYTPRNGGSGFIPISMAVHNNMLYMSGYDSVSATQQLWVSDGTTAGTSKVTNSPNGFYPLRLYSFQNKLIMTAGDTVSGNEELFATDGTAAGTVCPTPPALGQYAFQTWEAWVPFNNALYFRAAYGYFADLQLCRYTETKPTGIVNNKEIPGAFALFQNYPNPFNPSTTISYSIAKAGEVKLNVYDIIGNKVASVVNENKPAGSYSVQFNAAALPSGIYFYRLESESYFNTKKFILLK